MTVLMYHAITEADGFFAVSPNDFDAQMKYVRAHAEPVTLAQAFEHAQGNRVKRDSVAVTFDDGYLDFSTHALEVLKREGIPATVFVLGDAPDRKELGNDLVLMNADQVRSLSKEPLVAIESHALSHRKLKHLTPAELMHELTESRRLIEERTGTKPVYIAYPKGSYNGPVIEAVKKAGYEGACSVIERGVRPGDEVFALPRVQVDRSTTLALFAAKLSLAADWYYALWLFAKRLRGK